MKRMAMVMLAGSLLVCGCGGGRTYYKNANASPAQESKDYSECDFEAAKATGNLPSKAEREERVKELVDS